MSVNTSLVSSIPLPTQQRTVPVDVPPIASVKIGEVIDKEPKPKLSFVESILERLENFKQTLIRKRIDRLESIPPEKRTPVQQAEIDANNKALNYNV